MASQFSFRKHDTEVVACVKCPRLVEWREEVARKKRRTYQNETYWGRPVPGFGDRNARVLVIGLAPGAHGSNRTGRQFTGDASGSFLFPALHRAGFASRPESIGPDDGLTLFGMFITAVCRCAPPANKPTTNEILNCRPFLQKELEVLSKRDLEVVVALGQVAFDNAAVLLDAASPRPKFSHGAVVKLEGRPSYLVGSYHPSRQNTQTGRLTASMFDMIWRTVRELLEKRE